MTSQELFNESKKYISGGVNSPVRAFGNVGGTPFFTSSVDGARINTCDGRSLVDFVCTWGPALFGHNNPVIRSAVENAIKNGTSFGTPSPSELEMAKMINKLIPCAELVRMTNSGTEATMSCVRLARGWTKRDIIVKFSGCYHGHSDSLLVKAGSGALTFGNPDSAGIPNAIANLTIVLPFNDFNALNECFAKYGEQIAGVIVEPYPANVGLIVPREGFLQHLRNLCTLHGALLIFDEVITGFRVASGGAQARENVLPDLCALGKIIGGGLPVGAFCGKREIMEYLAPLGPVYQAGTLSGNPLAMAAGVAALKLIETTMPYNELERKSKFISNAVVEASKEKGIALQAPMVASLMSFFFNEERVDNLEIAMKSSKELYKKFFFGCLERGVYIAPSPFEILFMSSAHTQDDLDFSADAMCKAIKSL
ncbi:MAG: glutamate-1-semialdehyde-2,1-aminomutase [Verrucomicrobiaceae bacterium]|nr:glutamate-1-semialdehyde-2,1-aminomutase [Verrucomicrobiaceae bacterium]